MTDALEPGRRIADRYTVLGELPPPGVPADNPWQATTLEWTTTSPPPAGNFAVPPVVTTGPYRYGEEQA